MNNDLFEGALDVVYKSGFVTRLSCKESSKSTTTTGTTLVCCSSASARDVKALLRERLNLGDEELRLRDKHGKYIFGNFEKSPPCADTMLSWEAVTVDPHLLGLCQVVGMGDEAERDRMMERMMTPRRAQECPGSHSLTATNYGHGGLFDVVCDKCNHNLESDDNWFGCRVCNFDLCRNCHQNDQGAEHIMIGASKDPYDEVATIAKQLGTRYAKLVCNRWLSRRRPNSFWLIWEHTNWGWVPPSNFSRNKSILTNQDIEDLRLSRDHLLVAPGARLVIRLSEDLRGMVLDANNNNNDDDNQGDERLAKKIRIEGQPTRELLPGEIDQILPNGATAEELEGYAKQICLTEPAWQHIKDQLELKLAASGWNWDRTALFHDVMLELESMEIGKVAYRLTAVAGRNWTQVRL
ncbi:expressed unknown protein [Seminavis robusta]|uniref:ZZ-type domain-containing protein n=1 Tax=Seminavis robusta TaxID=568900 RepID=A0A9N8DJW1_9STRA|nr:expressed unknown protein [Seminavis robusta]|eukprot:Sro194_g082880.1 n/a (409) ;mRNA; r:54773-55999